MGYWIFMTAMCLLIPGILMGFGSVCRNKAPENINLLYGYRTSMSMKNQDTWEFANKLWGKLAWKWGLITLIVSLIPMLAVFFAGEDTVSIVGSVIVVLQLIPLLATIPVVERALKHEFDPDGRQRNPN